MSIESVLLPLFVQVLLTFTLLGILAVRRQRMFRNREMHPQDLAVRGAREPPPIAQVAGSFQNQFEIPVLFCAGDHRAVHAQGRSRLRDHVLDFRARAPRAGGDSRHLQCRAEAWSGIRCQHACPVHDVGHFHRPNSRASVTLHD